MTYLKKRSQLHSKNTHIKDERVIIKFVLFGIAWEGIRAHPGLVVRQSEAFLLNSGRQHDGNVEIEHSVYQSTFRAKFSSDQVDVSTHIVREMVNQHIREFDVLRDRLKRSLI
jgi:hypothetical protein